MSATVGPQGQRLISGGGYSMLWLPIIKTLAYGIAIFAALFLSLIFYVVIAADPKPGTHPSRPVGWSLAAVVVAWALVAGLNRWRKLKIQ